MSRLLLALLLLGSGLLSAQYQYQRINNWRELRLAPYLYDTVSTAHTAIRPRDLSRLPANADPARQDYGPPGPKKGWLGRKLFSESLLYIDKPGFALRLDPVVNFRGALDPAPEGRRDYFVNTRGFSLEARLGQKVTLTSSYLENQGRFPDYVSAFGGVVPGQGQARQFGEDALDYGLPSGAVSFRPDSIFSFSLGQGRHFFGEGYRSLLLSDAAFNYPFFRIETQFWKIHYVNLWAQMYDLRPSAAVIDAFPKKYFSSHYLSIDLTDRLNVGFFESIVVGDTTQLHGPDIAFFNPVIFYRPVEFAVGSAQGNALMGAHASYLLSRGWQVYGQFVLDEFNLSALRARQGSWVNKYGWQLGSKCYDCLGHRGLFLRMEYNTARPYTYSHRVVLTNYAHYNQPLAHPWGANFGEALVEVAWQRERWEVGLRYHRGVIGLDEGGGFSEGSDVYRSYDERARDLGNQTGQGVRGDLRYLDLRAAWLVNGASGLKLELGWQFRHLEADESLNPGPLPPGRIHYIYAGLRTEFFNRYYDF